MGVIAIEMPRIKSPTPTSNVLLHYFSIDVRNSPENNMQQYCSGYGLASNPDNNPLLISRGYSLQCIYDSIGLSE